MKKKWSWKKITAAGASAAMALSLGFGVLFGNLDFSNKNVEGGGIDLTASAETTQVGNVIYDSTDTSKLGTFENGTTYWYTDYESGVKLSNGDASVTTDRIPVTVVKTGNAAGSKLNPYVINSKEDWASFVTYVASSGVNYGANKFFVLNNDLDYEGGLLPLVEQFSGTFYGNGHIISNAVYQDLYSVNEQTIGLFRMVTGSPYISDINVLNYRMGSLTESTQNAYGAIAGVAMVSNLTIVNCTTKGVMLMNTTKVPDADKGATGVASWSFVAAGILGCFEGNSGANLYFYKNTVDLDATIQTSRNGWPMLGGMIGTIDAWNYTYRMNTARFYDCYASVNYDLSSDDTISNAFSGFVAFTRNITESIYRNCVFIANYKVNDTYTPYSSRPASVPRHYIALGLVTTIGERRASDTVGYRIDCKNFFGYGFCVKGTTKYAMPLVGEYMASGFTNVTNKFTNCNIYSGSGMVPATVNSTIPSADKPAASLDAWKEEAKSVLTNEEIWIPSVIDDIQEPAAGSNIIQKPNIAETPIQVNRTRITFKNADNSALTFVDGGEATRDYELDQIGDALPTPVAPDGKRFVGWSLDSKSDATWHTTFPEKLYGNVVMYPVWDMTGVRVTVAREIAAGAAGEESANEQTVNAIYIGSTAVTLRARISAEPTNNNYTVAWQWYKDGAAIDGATSDTLELTEQTSGNYYAKASLVHTSELWRTDSEDDANTKSNTFDITIGQGALSSASIATLKDGEKAYWGQKLDDLVGSMNVQMQNSAGYPIDGTITWNYTGPDSEQYYNDVQDVTTIYSATFHPDAKYNRNYVDTRIRVQIEPTVLQYKYLFTDVAAAVSGQEFAFSIRYNNGETDNNGRLTQKSIASTFEDAYFEWLDEIEGTAQYDAIIGFTPYFGGDDIFTYGASTTEVVAFNKATVAGLTDNTYNIPVTFQKQSPFTVTHIFGDKVANVTTPTLYGEKVVRPNKNMLEPDESNSGSIKFLQSWYASDADGKYLDEEGNIVADGSDAKAVWNFNTRINGNVYIKAYWFEGYLALGSITARVNGNRTFIAQNAPRATDYLVTGTYTAYASKEAFDNGESPLQENGHDRTVQIVLSADEYTVSAGTPNRYHVESPSVTISADAPVLGQPSQTKKITCPVDNLNILPMTVALGDYVTFRDGAKTENGLSQRISLATFNFPEGVTLKTVTYTYLSVGGATLGYEVYNVNGAMQTLAESTLGADDVKTVGVYYVSLSVTFTTPDYAADGERVVQFTIEPQPITVTVEWDVEDPTAEQIYTFNGQVQHPNIVGFKLADGTRVDIPFEYTLNANQTVSGSGFSIGFKLSNIRYEVATGEVTVIAFRINPASVEIPTLQDISVVYNGSEYSLADYTAFSPEELEHLVRMVNGTATNVGTITTQFELRDPNNSRWKDNTNTPKSFTWEITQKILTAPTFTETLTYSGDTFNIVEHLNFYDGVAMKAEGGDPTGKDAGSYFVIIELVSGNYAWEDPDFDGRVDWRIQKKNLSLSWNSWNFVQTGQPITPQVTRISGLVGEDQNQASAALRELSYSGDMDIRTAGSYLIEVAIQGNSWLNKNYTIGSAYRSLAWVIRLEGEQVIELVWDLPTNNIYTFNDQVQAPRVVAIYDESGMPLDMSVYIINYSGDYLTSKWYGGPYTVTAEVTDINGNVLRVRQPLVTYSIRQSPDGGGIKPGEPEPIKPGDNGEGNNPGTGTIAVIPQLIVSGVAVVLILVFGIMTLNYASVAKNAKNKVKKLAQMTYSFAPMGLLAFGLTAESSVAWWGIAGGLMGVALLMAIMMFVFRGKSKKALAMLEEEQERIEEEKEMAREAERERRDNEFKMMFAAMQQNYQQPQVGYDDMQNMIASAVTALLPGLQQTMQALPPAQSETDELRAQMAQQQEMLSQLLQNQQAQQNYSAPAAPAQEYTETDQASEAAFANSVDEHYTLEELYGRLTDDAKRLYYEIGGYIMNKPNTNQNDGKYAVLFKYRGKTLFKLCIKNDIPVLAYALDNNSLAEMFVDDEAALDDAKQIIDMRIKRTDRDMNK